MGKKKTTTTADAAPAATTKSKTALPKKGKKKAVSKKIKAPPKKDRKILTSVQLKMGKRRVGIKTMRPEVPKFIDEFQKETLLTKAALTHLYNLANGRIQVTGDVTAKAYQMIGYPKLL